MVDLFFPETRSLRAENIFLLQKLHQLRVYHPFKQFQYAIVGHS